MKNLNFKKNKKILFFLIPSIIILFPLYILLVLFMILLIFPDPSGINEDEFDKIKLGHSQFEVNAIISESDDPILSEKISDEKNGKIFTYSYKYLGEKKGYAIITYQADYSDGEYFVLPIVIKKENFNIK